MKKTLTLSVATLALAANAQVTPNIVNEGDAQAIHSNLVVYMCAPGVTETVADPQGMNVDYIKSAYEELGINFQCNDATNTNMVCITKDYTDPETGATFPAGYYYSDKVGGSRSYFGKNEGATGLKNVKKMIFYWAAAGNVQFSSYLVREGGITVDNLSTGSPVTVENRYTMDPNCKIKFSVPELDGTYTTTRTNEEGETFEEEKPIFTSNNYYNTMLDENGNPTTTWTTFACTRPAKLTLDFTQPIDVDKIDTNLDFSSILDGDITVPYGHYEFAYRDENGKDKAGNPIPWSADNILQQGYKRAAYLLGIAMICGDDNAQTYYANVSNSTDDDECYWEENAVAAHTALAATDDPAANLFYSWMLTDDFKTFAQQHYTAGISNVATDTKSMITYNLFGQQMQQAAGFCIQNGKVVNIKK